MTNYIKFIKMFCVILLTVLAVYMLLDLFPMWLYNSTTTGKEVTSLEYIEDCKEILNKKYEIILYGRNEQLKNIYARKYFNKIENFTGYEDILNNFYMVNVNKVYKKFNNVYIVKYDVGYMDNSTKEFTLIIKMNSDKSKAVIIYDNMFH